MAVHAGDACIGMDAGLPDFKIRMLGLQHGGLGIRVYPVLSEAASLTVLIELELLLRLPAIDEGMAYPAIFLHEVILIVALTTLLANLIGFLPMQLGVQEGGFVISIAALGLSAALGIFVSLICRVREIVWIFIGIALMKLPEKQE